MQIALNKLEPNVHRVSSGKFQHLKNRVHSIERTVKEAQQELSRILMNDVCKRSDTERASIVSRLSIEELMEGMDNLSDQE